MHVLGRAREMDARKGLGDRRGGRKGEQKLEGSSMVVKKMARLRRARLNQSRAPILGVTPESIVEY